MNIKTFHGLTLAYIFFALLFFSSFSNAKPNDIYNVVGYFNEDLNAPYNTRDIYGSVIRYYIPPEINNVQITVDDITVHVNLEDEILSAINEWAHESNGLRFERILSSEGQNGYIRFGITTNANTYGNTVFNSLSEIDGSISRVNLEPRGFTRQIPNLYSGLRNVNAISSATDITELVRMMVNLTLRHEIGHALGLAHHDENGVHVGPNEIGRLIVMCGLSASRPSIMLSGRSGNYLRILSEHLHRPVTISDIAISRNDLQGAGRMFESHSRRHVLSLACAAAFMSLRGSEL